MNCSEGENFSFFWGGVGVVRGVYFRRFKGSVSSGFCCAWGSESRKEESPCLLEWDAGVDSFRYNSFSEGRWHE